MNLEELLYAETHEWVHVVEDNGEKIATVGISAFAVEQLTDLVFMELPQVGTAVEAGNQFVFAGQLTDVGRRSLRSGVDYQNQISK